jgi:two-component system, NtrC family, response regulator AtoC
MRTDSSPVIARGCALECGTSPAAQRMRKLIDQSAASDLPVLITGEMGVGKDLIAREIHRRSARSSQPLLEVNCAALADGDPLFEQEPSPESTVFLNGIGELSAACQEKLLRLLRRGDGAANGHSRPLEVRLIAATHRDLAHAVETAKFSEDLYYRLNLIHIHVPPLRAHVEDIPALLQYFLREHGRRDGRPEEIPEIIRARMLAYEWPGNIRELENAIRSFIALGDASYVLEELDARSSERDRAVKAASGHASSFPPPSWTHDDDGYRVDLKKLGREASDAAEREAISNMLVHTMGNKKSAARRLGISYKALLYKIRDFGISEHISDDELESSSRHIAHGGISGLSATHVPRPVHAGFKTLRGDE